MDAQAQLASALEGLADSLTRHPSPVVGLSVSVTADGRSTGPVVGMAVNVTGGPGRGPVTGVSVSVSSGDRNAADAALIAELREAANAVRVKKAPKSWVSGLLDRATALGNRAIEAAIVTAVTALTKYYVEGT